MPKASSPLVKIQDVPDVPTIGTATGGIEEALVAFTPAVTGGRAYQYRALSTPDGIEAVGSSSPILVPGLTGGTSYTFQVRGETNTGASTGYSSASNAVVPEELVTSSFDLLETQVLGSDVSSVTFSSLSAYAANYQHLQLRVAVRSTYAGSAESFGIRFNGVSTTSYSWHRLIGLSGAVTSGQSSSTTAILAGFIPSPPSASSHFGPSVIDILDPFETTKNTTTRSLTGFSSSESIIGLASGAFYNTSAVNSITFISETGANLVTGSRFSLYGIRKAA